MGRQAPTMGTTETRSLARDVEPPRARRRISTGWVVRRSVITLSQSPVVTRGDAGRFQPERRLGDYGIDGRVRIGYRHPDNQQLAGQAKGRQGLIVHGRRPRSGKREPLVYDSLVADTR